MRLSGTRGNKVKYLELLKDGLVELGFEADLIPDLCNKMDSYTKELMLFNAAYDLVGATNEEDIVIRHILDSLSGVSSIKEIIKELPETDQTIRIGDIGSGGGLPGIPLASALPEINFTLVERMSKRCAFLDNCRAILGLKNVTVENLQAEQFPAEQLDIAVFRAFRPLDKKMIKTLLRLIKPNGFLVAYKAKTESITEEMDAIKSFVPVYKTKPLTVPFLQNHERHLVIIPKN